MTEPTPQPDPPSEQLPPYASAASPLDAPVIAALLARIADRDGRVEAPAKTQSKLLLGLIAGLLGAVVALLVFFGQAMLSRFDSIDARFTSNDARFDSIDARFTRLDARFTSIDERFDRLESRYDARFDSIDARFDRLESRYDARFDSIDARFDSIYDILLDHADRLARLETNVGLLLDALDIEVVSAQEPAAGSP